MNSTCKNFSTETVEGVLKRSKQLQNKIRQELSLSEIESPIATEFVKREKLTSVLENAMLGPYANSTVADYVQNNLSFPKKTNNGMKTRSEEAAGIKANTSISAQKSSNKLNVTDSSVNFHRASASVGTQGAYKSTKKFTSHVRVFPKRITTRTLNNSPINASNISFESNKLVATSSYRLPLQRFAESNNKNIDFFKEHPHLELDMASEDTTLFPRRFNRSTECLSENEECVNVFKAEVKPPQKTAVVIKQDTWNGILMKNKPNSKATNKIVRLRKTKEVDSESTLKCFHIAPRQRIEEPDKSYDIISSIPSKGIFTLQKQSELLAKQKKCNFQRFPVLYIRPECQIQKVASISICGESENISRTTMEVNPTRNVKYFECKHGDIRGDGNKSFDMEIIPDGGEVDVREENVIKEVKAPKENKFFKALECTNLYQSSSTYSASPPFTCQSSSSNQSLSSLSSSSLLKRVSPSTNVNEIYPSLRSASKSILSPRIKNDSVKVSQRLREAHVQTEDGYKETVSTNTSPLHNPAQYPPQPEVTTSVNINDTLIKIARLHKAEYSIEDDIITKIFERIRKDLPDALDVYKKRNNSADNGITANLPISPSKEEHNKGKRNQKTQNQTSTSNDESSVELLPNPVESILPRVQEKRQEEDNHSQTISQRILNDCYNDYPTFIPKANNEVSLQQTKFKKINSSTVHDAISETERIKKETHEYPTGAEIKRAVKIFIDSLKLDGCGSEKKEIINDIRTIRRSITLQKPQLISGDRLNQCTSSDSSNNTNSLSRMKKMARNVKRTKSTTVRWGHISGSSTSTGLSSTDLETESDVTNDIESLSLLSNNSNNMSDGEIKSIGEI